MDHVFCIKNQYDIFFFFIIFSLDEDVIKTIFFKGFDIALSVAINFFFY